MAFLQDNNEDLKVSMRKMPNSQATGEELGRIISCSWNMEAFDMLPTVETLKRASKRRSALWSLNAVLQLTQDLTRIHNVNEHASWSEERAAISQVAALYQNENREVPLLPDQKFAPVQRSHQNDLFNNFNQLINGQPVRQHHNLFIRFLGSPLRSFHSDAASFETDTLATMIERYQNVHMVAIELETEAGKLMHALSLNKANNINITIAIEFLSRSILCHLINDSQHNPQYNNQRSVINIEKCPSNLLHIAKWSRTAIESNHEATTNNIMSEWVLILLENRSFEKKIPLDELLIGELLNFSTLTCPNLAKSWFRFAVWAYLWRRELLARYISLSSLDLGQQVRSMLPSEVLSDDVTEISRILSSIRI
ncbi:unnamed protein product [Rotaria magnacalcarata]|uniref:Uncharacterized protein n=1 Tax=Rotaria magnacalcarata TaxID=392030 RepID=A0A8S2N0H7_9BILA|nr:unnamed protein product [Rotaria magnacalcarata]